jgi:hypothetical protein
MPVQHEQRCDTVHKADSSSTSTEDTRNCDPIFVVTECEDTEIY